MLSKSLSTSEKRARLHEQSPALAEFAQALYPLLIAHCDDFGRVAGDVFTVKHQIDPTSPRSIAEFAAALDALTAVDLIRRYAVNRRTVIAIVDFDEHQIGLHKRTRSHFPEPPGTSGNPPEDDGNSGSRARAEREQEQEQEQEQEVQQADPIGSAGSDQQAKAREVRAQLRRAHDPNPKTADENVAVIANLIATEFDGSQLPEAELRAAVKSRCAELHITYDGATIGKALDSARHHRQRA